MFYFFEWGIIHKTEITNLLEFLNNANQDNFIDSTFQILRSHPIEKKILDINFYCSEVKYPLLVHRFGNFDILVEIIIKEKQRAVGIQPMLYVCFPIAELKSAGNKTDFIGRVAESKECGYLTLNSSHKDFILESFKIFGILSASHNYDIKEILKIILSKMN